MSCDVTEIYASHADYETKKRWRRIFDAVVSAYQNTLFASPLVACSYDESIRPRKLGPAIIEFKVDVENITRRCLKLPALLKAWQQIVEGDESVPRAVFLEIAYKCGREYALAKLIPYDYFKHIRKGRADRRPPATSVAAA